MSFMKSENGTNIMTNFIIYLDRETGKLNKLSEEFAEEYYGKDGKILFKILTGTHDKIMKDLGKKRISFSNTILSGTYTTESQTKKQEMLTLRPLNWFSFNPLYAIQEAERKNITRREEEKYFADFVLNFVLGNVSEEEFRNVLEKKIVHFSDFLASNGGYGERKNYAVSTMVDVAVKKTR